METTKPGLRGTQPGSQRLIAALTRSQTRERIQEATALRGETRQARRKARQTRGA
jgi:hypothetical protein